MQDTTDEIAHGERSINASTDQLRHNENIYEQDTKADKKGKDSGGSGGSVSDE